MAEAVQSEKFALRNRLTSERLKKLLSYDPETGHFEWRIQRTNKAKPGAKAGYRDAQGYIQISVDKTSYLAHRLAWLYVYGDFPNGLLDHINCDRCDNRISNIRQVNRWQNRCNTNFKRSAGLKGAYPLPSGNWYAQIGKGRKHIYLGSFCTEEEAHAAYCAKARELFGEFAKTE